MTYRELIDKLMAHKDIIDAIDDALAHDPPIFASRRNDEDLARDRAQWQEFYDGLTNTQKEFYRVTFVDGWCKARAANESERRWAYRTR